MNTRNRIDVDIVIVGGGIAGLWLLDVLAQRGFEVMLLERTALGDGQTIASQGLIHGGLKYALSGTWTGASDAIAGMPQRWRRCLEGSGDVDLRSVQVSSRNYYLWANDSTVGQLGAFFASKTLRGRITRLQRADYPPAFAHDAFKGVVYELPDFVLDVRSLLATLAAPHRERIYRANVSSDDLETDPRTGIGAIRAAGVTIRAARYLFCAGAGNEPLVRALGSAAPRMQRRPLKQVLVSKQTHPPIHAHCIGGSSRHEPRLTITTHVGVSGNTFYLGGQLATDGATRDDADQLAHARRELAECLPWLDFDGAELHALTIDRAEPRTVGRQRPDRSFVAACGNALVCWPTKLSLAPDLGDRVLEALGDLAPSGRSAHRLPSQSVVPAVAPWGTV